MESAMNPAEIPGWGRQLFPLYDLAVKRFPSGSRFVEIGCFLGMSACYGAQAIKMSRKKIRSTALMIGEAWMVGS